jgi:hypothetical protein
MHIQEEDILKIISTFFWTKTNKNNTLHKHQASKHIKNLVHKSALNQNAPYQYSTTNSYSEKLIDLAVHQTYYYY